MDWFSDALKRANDAKGQAKDAKEQVTRTNSDEQGGGKYFQSPDDESSANDPIHVRQQTQNLPQVALASVASTALSKRYHILFLTMTHGLFLTSLFGNIYLPSFSPLPQSHLPRDSFQNCTDSEF
jgi:hypothetical protein